MSIPPTIAAVVVLMLAPVSQANPVYVDDDATPGGDGASWATALSSLQDAIGAANPGDKVHVAQGTYRPDLGAGLTPGDQSLSFDFTGLIVRGGYAGPGSDDPDAQDPSLYPSVLSGDLNGDDGADFQNTGDNTHMIFVGSDCTLDGFEIAGAAGGETGASIGASTLVANCRFHHNSGADGGALTVTTDDGHVSSDVRDCVFELNRAVWDGVDSSGTGFGGAVYLVGNWTSFNNCRFSRNHAVAGGAVGSWFEAHGGGAFKNCIFTANVADHPDAWSAGGAIAFFAVSTHRPGLYYCLVYGNRAPNGLDGGVYVTNLGPFVVKSILWGNSDTTGRSFEAQIGRTPGGPMTRPPLNLIENAPALADVFISSEPRFVDPLGHDGVLGTDDDDFRPAFGSPTIDVATEDPTGGVTLDARGLPRVVDDPATPNIVFNTIADLGPYEYQEDCDGSGTVDSVEIVNGTLADCDANGVPDVCQTFHDCNSNSMPDECEIAEGTAEDCNGNGVPDSCDIAAGTSSDNDHDGVPDECEPAILRVNAGTPLRGTPADGSTWGGAFTELRDALAMARSRHAPTEIWVAAGTYRPAAPGGSIRASFVLAPGLTLLGGFYGSETDASQRDPVANPTILSGDLDSNDDPNDPATLEDNTFALLGVGAGAGRLVDGFSIRGGFARLRPGPGSVLFLLFGAPDEPDGSATRQFGDTGSALRLSVGDATLKRCRISDCSVGAGSVVDSCLSGRLTLDDCVVEHNTALRPGANIIGNDEFRGPLRGFSDVAPDLAPAQSLEIVRSVLRANDAAATSNGTADVIDVGVTHVALDSVLVTANTGFDASIDAYLGDSHAHDGSRITTTVGLTNSGVVANDGTAILIDDENIDTDVRELFLHDCTITDNDAGIDADRTFVEMQNSILFGNGSTEFTPSYTLVSPYSLTTHNTIQDWDPADNDGTTIVANIADDPMFADTLGPDGMARTGDEDFSLLSPSTSIDSGDATSLPPGVKQDLAGHNRLTNDPLTPSTGVPNFIGLYVDRGAYETQPVRSPIEPHGQHVASVLDFVVLAENFGRAVPPGTGGDLNADARVDLRDFALFAESFPSH